MATLDYYQRVELEAGGVSLALGSRATPKEITVDGYISDETKSLATATTWDVWAAGSGEAVGDFNLLWVESTQNVFLELTVDANNGVGREELAIEVQANVPFSLAADDAMANYTANFAGGTEDVIDQIRIRNVSGSTATVRVVLVT